MLARIAGRGSQVVLGFQRTGEPLHLDEVPASQVAAELVEGVRRSAAPHRHLVVMQREPRTTQQVGMRRTRQPVHLEVEPHLEEGGIDECA